MQWQNYYRKVSRHFIELFPFELDVDRPFLFLNIFVYSYIAELVNGHIFFPAPCYGAHTPPPR